MVDSIGLLSGNGAIIHPHIIISSAQHFEGYVFCVFIEKNDIKDWTVLMKYCS